QRDQDGQQRRQAGQHQVLEDTGGDAVRAHPMTGRREPLDNRQQEAHPRARVHGVTCRCSSTSSPSITTASSTDRSAPISSGVLKNCCMPCRIRKPRPPCPITAVTV